MNHIKRIIVTLLFTVALCWGAFAQEDPSSNETAALEALILSHSRPTMSQIASIVGIPPRQEHFFDPVWEKDAIGHDPRFQTQMSTLMNLPRVIALMEMAFPDAVWAPLGRDAVIFGDLLDAFYLSIGQSNRVSRLNASGTSFAHVTPELTFRFMHDAGADQALQQGRPFVCLDRTTYREQSQSGYLMRTIYGEYKKRGVSPNALLNRINFIGLSNDTNVQRYNSGGIAKYFSGLVVSNSRPNMILQMPVGSWTDSEPWHDTFGPFAVQSNGKLEGRPGLLAHIGLRRLIVWQMIKILKAVSEPRFLENVKAEAKTLGYEFELTSDFDKIKAAREKALEADRLQQEKEAKEQVANFLKKTVYEGFAYALEKASQLDLPAEQTAYFSDRATLLIQWFDAAMEKRAELAQTQPDLMKDMDTNIVALHFIAEITRARRGRFISSKDYRRLLAQALSASTANEKFLAYFEKILRSEPELRDTLQTRSEFFLTTFKNKHRKGTANTEAVYRKIQETVMTQPSTCAEVFAAAALPL